MRFNCKDCANRHIGCHERCESYKKDKALADKESQSQRMEDLYENHGWNYYRRQLK